MEYYRKKLDGSCVKIAYGSHRSVWVKRNENGKPLCQCLRNSSFSADDIAFYVGFGNHKKVTGFFEKQIDGTIVDEA